MLFYRSSKSGSPAPRAGGRFLIFVLASVKRFQFLSCSLLGLCQRFSLLLEAHASASAACRRSAPRRCAGRWV